jgi:hypothetical protein
MLLLVLTGVGLVPLSSLHPGPALALAQDDARPQLPIKRWVQSERVHRQLEKPTTVDFIDLPLKDCLRFVSEYHAVPFRTDQEAIEQAGISLDEPVRMILSGISMRNVLNLLLEPAQLGFHVERDGLVITTRERAAVHLEKVSYDPWRFAGKGIAAEDLADAIVATIVPESWQTRGGQGSLRVEEGILHARVRDDVEEQMDALVTELHWALFAEEPEAARLIGKSYAIGDLQDRDVDDGQLLEWFRHSLLGEKQPAPEGDEGVRIESDGLILKQPAWVHDAANEFFRYLRSFRRNDQFGPPTVVQFQAAAAFLPLEAKWHLSRRRLGKKVTLQLDRVPLEDTILWIRDKCGFQIWPDAIALKKQKTDVKMPVTLRAQEKPVPEILDAALDSSQLDWYMAEPGIIVITSAADASRRSEQHVYQTKKLLRAGESDERLLRRITTSIEPGSWASAGGHGTASALSGLLIVSHNRRIHAQIERLAAEHDRPE